MHELINQSYAQQAKFKDLAKESYEIELKMATEDQVQLLTNQDEKLPEMDKKMKDLTKGISTLHSVMNDDELDNYIA